MHSYLKVLVAFALSFSSLPSIASHFAGGGFTYRFLGDTLVGGSQARNYEVTLWLYQDCVTGTPDAVNQDNPAYFTIYENGVSAPWAYDTAIFYDPTPGAGGSISVTSTIANSPCGEGTLDEKQSVCLLRKKFTKRYTLPNNADGYKIVYQRCCFTGRLSNILSPGDFGVTMFCDIPGNPISNNSARFQFSPSQIVCVGKLLNVDVSATDPDGDSLTYEFGVPFKGASDNNIKPLIATAPPYDSVEYMPPYTARNPFSAYPAVSIGLTDGWITGTPNKVGTYFLKVLCHEWRNGQMINTVSHEFQWTVIDCQGITNRLVPDAGGNRTVLVGEKIEFHVTGGERYYWTPGTFLDNAFIADPVGTFTKPGEYTYRISAVDDSGCTGTSEIKVTVLEHSDVAVPNAFTPNSDGINDLLAPLAVKGSHIQAFHVYSRWGIEVFRSVGSVQGWNGEYNGTPQPGAVYTWTADFIDTNSKPHTKAGTTILIR